MIGRAFCQYGGSRRAITSSCGRLCASAALVEVRAGGRPGRAPRRGPGERRASPAGSSRRWSSASAARSIRTSPTWAGCSSSTRSPACTATTPAPAATRPPTASATPSRSPSASRTTTSSGPDRAGPRNQRRTPMVDQQRVLSEADVERPVQRPLGRPVRQLRGFQFPEPEGHHEVPARRPQLLSPARRPGPHPADRADRGGRLHRAPAGSSTTASARPCRRRTPRPARATSRSARPCSLASTRRRTTGRSSGPCIPPCGRAGRSPSRCSARRSPSSSSR